MAMSPPPLPSFEGLRERADSPPFAGLEGFRGRADSPPFAELEGFGPPRASRRPMALGGKMKGPPSVLWHAMSGTIGSLLAECILFPLDRVKLIVQTAAASDSRGFFATLVHLIEERGLIGMYGGMGGAMIKECVHSLNFWLWHGFLFRYVATFDDTSKTPTMSRLLLNMLAKQLNWLCTVPFEAISNVNQLSENSPGFFATALSIYRDGGIGAFYRGLPVSLLLAINPAIMNTLITSLLRVVTAVRQARGEDYLDSRDHSAAIVGGATGVAKAVATFATYPLIRGKILQQTRGKTIGLISVLKEIVASEGVRGLYRGVLAMTYKTVLWNIIMMAFKHVLGPKRAVTPPASPAHGPLANLRQVPSMAREPFPAELLTVEKLHEVLQYLKLEQATSNNQRIENLEEDLREAAQDIREVKLLLMEALSKPRATPPATRVAESYETASGHANLYAEDVSASS